MFSGINEKNPKSSSMFSGINEKNPKSSSMFSGENEKNPKGSSNECRVGHYLYQKNSFYKDDRFNPELTRCDFF
jgi:hypothetical protein